MWFQKFKNNLFFLAQSTIVNRYEFFFFIIFATACFYLPGRGNVLIVLVIASFFTFRYFFTSSFNNRVINLFLFLLLFYCFWVGTSAIIHISALKILEPLTPITVSGRTNYWGLITIKQVTTLYLLFPILFFAVTCLFLNNKNFIKWIFLALLIIVPSIIVALYQGIVDISFSNSNFWILHQRASGLANDSNGFGISLFFVFPICLLGFHLVRGYWKKISFVIMLIIVLGALFYSGSRTGLLGILLFCLFLPLIWIWARSNGQKWFTSLSTIITVVFFYVLCIGIFIFLIRLPESTTLTARLNKSLSEFKQGGLRELASNRFELGLQACRLSVLSPFAGFGPGGYWRNLENIRFMKKDIDEKRFLKIRNKFSGFDNANNQYLQMSSELGIPGALVNTFLHLWPLWMVFKIQKQIHNRKERWTTGVIFLTVCIMMFLYLTGPHVMNIDVLWLIVIYLSFLFVTALKHGYSIRPIKLKYLSLGFGILTIFFAFGSYERSFGSKGYKALQNLEWWPYKREFGYYHYEDWGFEKMRWTIKEASTRVKAKSNLFGLRVAAQVHNSSDPEGLKLKITLNGQEWDEVHFFNGGIKPLYYYLPHIKNEEIEIRTEVSKTFNPYRFGINTDDRELGVAMSQPIFLKIMPKDGVGFYDWESWGGIHLPGWPENKTIEFRWMRRRATFNLKNQPKNGIKLFLKCAHPDIKINPVFIIIRGDAKIIREVKFIDGQIKIIKFDPTEIYNLDSLTIEVSRTWNPKLAGISEDGRDLGAVVAILSD